MAKPVNRGARGPRGRHGRDTVGTQATERAIIEAANRLFLERGYVGTTMDAIAETAGVVVQTIYNSVGNKQAVLSRVLDYSAAGGRAPATVPDTMRERTAAVPEADGLVKLLAEWFAEVQPRIAPLMRTIQQGAAVAPEVETLERERAAQRFRNYHEAARAMAVRSDAMGMPVPEAAALIWVLGHPVVYRFLVLEQGWSVARYRRWLEGVMRAVFVAPLA